MWVQQHTREISKANSCVEHQAWLPETAVTCDSQQTAADLVAVALKRAKQRRPLVNKWTLAVGGYWRNNRSYFSIAPLIIILLLNPLKLKEI